MKRPWPRQLLKRKHVMWWLAYSSEVQSILTENMAACRQAWCMVLHLTANVKLLYWSHPWEKKTSMPTPQWHTSSNKNTPLLGAIFFQTTIIQHNLYASIKKRRETSKRTEVYILTQKPRIGCTSREKYRPRMKFKLPQYSFISTLRRPFHLFQLLICHLYLWGTQS